MPVTNHRRRPKKGRQVIIKLCADYLLHTTQHKALSASAFVAWGFSILRSTMISQRSGGIVHPLYGIGYLAHGFVVQIF